MLRASIFLVFASLAAPVYAQDCFFEFMSIPSPGSDEVATADIDNDGDIDLLYGREIFLNTGDGQTYLPGQVLGARNDDIIRSLFADFDFDGDIDIFQSEIRFAVVGFDSTGYLWLNDGSGNFSMDPIPVFEESGTVSPRAVANFDSNSDLDLVIADIGVSGDTILRTLLNVGNGSVISDTSLASLQIGIIETADIDGDSDVDILATDFALRMFQNDGNGSFTAVDGDFGFNGAITDFCVGDFDADGDIDLVARREILVGGYFERELVIGLNDGNGNFTPNLLRDGIATRFGTGDFDGDGDLDFAFSNNFGSGGVSAFLNQGNAEFTELALSIDFVAAVADLNGDGRDDLIGADGQILLSQLPFLAGDVNLDGSVDLLDVAPFVDSITSQTYQAQADVNRDCEVDLLDVAPFVDLLD